MRRIGTDELEAERTQAAATGALDGIELRARHPHRRVRLLQRLGQHVAQGHVEILAVVLGAAILEHREDRLHRFFEHGALVLHGAAEGLQFGDRGALSHAELAASIAQQIEHGHPLGDPGRMVGGELKDAVTEPDILGALAGGGEEKFR